VKPIPPLLIGDGQEYDVVHDPIPKFQGQTLDEAGKKHDRQIEEAMVI
jgi:hypothetical protein